jgi:hypothetical protein
VRLGHEWRHHQGIDEDCSTFVVRYGVEGYENEIIGRCHYDTSEVEEKGEQLTTRLLKVSDKDIERWAKNPNGYAGGYDGTFLFL